MSKRESVDMFDVEMLACKILDLDYDEIDGDTNKIDESLFEEFNLTLPEFHEIICRLIPLIDVGRSPLTDILYKGFADKEDSMWLVKVEVDEDDGEDD